MEEEYHVHPYRHGAKDHNQLAGGIDFVALAKHLKQQVDELRGENERLRAALTQVADRDNWWIGEPDEYGGTNYEWVGDGEAFEIAAAALGANGGL